MALRRRRKPIVTTMYGEYFLRIIEYVLVILCIRSTKNYFNIKCILHDYNLLYGPSKNFRVSRSNSRVMSIDP